MNGFEFKYIGGNERPDPQDELKICRSEATGRLMVLAFESIGGLNISPKDSVEFNGILHAYTDAITSNIDLFLIQSGMSSPEDVENILQDELLRETASRWQSYSQMIELGGMDEEFVEALSKGYRVPTLDMGLKRQELAASWLSITENRDETDGACNRSLRMEHITNKTIWDCYRDLVFLRGMFAETQIAA